MPIIIDGYNLISAVGIMGRGIGPGSLERARMALLNILAESLEPGDIGRTTVVFDAKNSPCGLPQTVAHRGLTVLFAARYPDADSLIEELIDEESAPKSLTVVSSDHRIQRAARRRRATPVDSDIWYQGVLQQRRCRQDAKKSRKIEAKPPVPLLEEDVDYWIRQFGGESELQQFITEEFSETDSSDTGTFNPFPPGYGEDLENPDA